MRLLIVLILFVGCNAAKRAVHNIDDGFRIDSAAAAKRVAQIVPCITIKQDTTAPVIITTKTTDTITRVVKDTVKLKCKDGTFVDTIITKKYYDINHRITNTNSRYITKTIEDKGKDIIIRDIEKELIKQKSKTNFWMGWGIIATLLLLVSIIILLLKKSLKII